MKNTEHGEHGTSLVEVMLASLVALIIVGAVLSILIRQAHQRRATSETRLAMSAAANNLEQLRAVDETALVGLDGSGFDVRSPNGSAGGLRPVTGDVDGLPGLLTVTEEQSSGGVKIFRVVATVAWQGASGVRRLRLQTLVGERK